MCVCAWARGVRACVRARVRARVRAYVRVVRWVGLLSTGIACGACLLEDKNGEKLTNKDFLFNKMAKNSALFVSAFWKAI